MRRNSVTLLKFLIAALIVLAAGPLVMKMLSGGGKRLDEYIDVPRGLPVEPRENGGVQHFRVSAEFLLPIGLTDY